MGRNQTCSTTHGASLSKRLRHHSILLHPALVMDGAMFNVHRELPAMANTPRLYETAFIVNAGLDDPQIEAVIEKVKEAITKHGGTITDLNKWGRKRFTYPIRKKNNGFYVITEFSGPGDLVAKLERHYQLDENILRYLTIVLDKHALKARAQRAAEAKNAESVAAEEAPKPAAVPENAG